jgi:hypothetical protein
MATPKNITQRAGARVAPKPGSAESIGRQTAELTRNVALLKASQAAVCEPVVSHDDCQAISHAYVRWLRARAAIRGDEIPEDEQAALALYAEEMRARRELFSLRAAYSDDVWHKFEAFEAELTDERVIGRATESLLMLALGSIKTDLVNLGIGRGQ